MKRLLLLLCIITLACFFACITGCEIQSVVPSENGNNQAVVPDPSTDDPVTPDPITPDPVNPDPVNPDPITPDPIIPDPQPVQYVVSGKIDGEKYGVKSGDIVATASNGKTVSVNSDLTFSVSAEEGALSLSFTAANYGEITDSFSVSGNVVKNYAFGMPEINTHTTSFNKVHGAENRYKVTLDNGVPYNCATFDWIQTKYFVIESDVSILNLGTSGDYGVGFVIGGCNLSSQYYAPHVGTACGLLISRKGSGKWKVEMVYFNENGTVVRDKVKASFDTYNYMHPSWRIETANDVSSDMTTAMNGKGGSAHLKAVRNDKLVALFINDKYVGGFMTEQYEGQKISTSSSEDYIGLYERGGIECVFNNVTFDVRKSVSDAAIKNVAPQNCKDKTMQAWGGFALTDGTNTVYSESIKNVVSATGIANNSGVNAAAFTNVNSKYWVMETTVDNVVSHTDWNGVYLGFLVNGWTTSCINIYHVNVPWEQSFCLEGLSGNPWIQNFVPDANYTHNVSLKEKYTALLNGGSMKYKIVRANDDFYIFIDGKLVASTSIAQLGVTDGETIHPSSNAIGFTVRGYTEARFSDINYSTDGITVYNELKAINKR